MKVLILSSILLIFASISYAEKHGSFKIVYAHPKTIRLGVSALSNHTQWENNYGKNLFHKNTKGVGVSAGFMFSRHFGIEAGYENYFCQKYNASIGSEEMVAGSNPIPAGHVVRMRTKMRQSHIPLMVLIKINNFGNCYALGGLGLSISRVKAHAFIYQYNTTMVDISSIFQNTKILPVIKIGMGYNVKDFSVEATVREVFNNYWRPHRLRAYSKTNPHRHIQAKNSLTCGLGIIYNISL